jgi:superfamily I DNA/RNA helicase
MFQKTKFHLAFEKGIYGGENTVIESGPGSGKTTSIKVVIVPTLLKNHKKGGAIAFNGKNAADLKSAINDERVESSTTHSALFQCFRKAFSKVKVEVSKPAGFNKFKKRFEPAQKGKTEIILMAIEAKKEIQLNEHEQFMVIRLVALMKMDALGITEEINDENIDKIIANHALAQPDITGNLPDLTKIKEFAIEVFNASIKAIGSIDYEDMLYLPIYMNLALPEWDFLVYDEGQDCKPIELEFIKRMASKGCQIVMVGDSNQAVNDFAGSMENALGRVSEAIKGVSYSMPVSYRCSKASAELANEIFPDSVIPWDGANEGSVKNIPYSEINIEEMDNASGLLARVHKNLMPMALKCLSKKLPFTYKGVNGLVVKMERALYHNSKANEDLIEVIRSLTTYQAKLEAENVNANGNIKPWVLQAGEVHDALKSLLAFCLERNETLSDAKGYLKTLANSEKPSMGPTLATLHASKGLQWEHVYLIGDLQSKLAITEKQLNAEKCLHFVGVTRSSDSITFVIAAQIAK